MPGLEGKRAERVGRMVDLLKQVIGVRRRGAPGQRPGHWVGASTRVGAKSEGFKTFK